MISAAQRQTSLDYIDLGVGAGAERVTGGVVPDGAGYYLTPAVLAGVDNSMRVAQEEIFGPGRVDHPVPRRGRRRPDRQRHPVRALRLAVDPRPRPGDAGGHGRSAPACCR